MGKNQNFTSETGLFSIEYPRTWELVVHDNIPAVFDPFLGMGALQFYAVRLSDDLTEALNASSFLAGESLTEKMALFLETQNVTYEFNHLKEHHQGEIKMVAHEFETGKRFFMAVMFEKKDVFVLSLYNSSQPPQDEEALVIAEIIRSLKIS